MLLSFSMAIPDNILNKWSHPGKDEVSDQTFRALKKHIENNFTVDEMFLQGSYKNHTNTRKSSDIDIIVACRGYTHCGEKGKKDIKLLKNDLYTAIHNKNGFSFSKGAKTLKYKGDGKTHIPADIVPCVKLGTEKDAGTALYNHSTGKIVTNHPKQHINNGNTKDTKTNGNFKKTVRMFKNAKSFMEDKKLIPKDSSPSYYIECLIYNVPDKHFKGTPSEIYPKVVTYLQSIQDSLRSMKCQNGINSMFNRKGNKWSIGNAKLFISQCVHIWNDWDEVKN